MRVTGSIKPNSQPLTKKPFIVGVAGGSGSGKTYFAKDLMTKIVQKHGAQSCQTLFQDNFYFDQTKNFDFDGGSVNFDHPSSIDFESLAACLRDLKSGRETQVPIYDFVTHGRKTETLSMRPSPVILVDGILIFNDDKVRSYFDDMIFFDTPEDLRFQRRLERDVKERGRTPEGVKAQFLQQVKPMHDKFVDPSKRHAQTVVCEMGEYQNVLDLYVAKLIEHCQK